MTNTDSLYREVSEFISKRIADGQSVVVRWAVQEIIDKKSAIEGADKPFYQVCAHKHIEGLVKRVVKKYAPSEEPSDKEITLFGFEHLQVAYPVHRDGENLIIPVHQLSDEELLARAEQYDEMAKGCRAHARELRSYLSERRKGEVA